MHVTQNIFGKFLQGAPVNVGPTASNTVDLALGIQKYELEKSVL